MPVRKFLFWNSQVFDVTFVLVERRFALLRFMNVYTIGDCLSVTL